MLPSVRKPLSPKCFERRIALPDSNHVCRAESSSGTFPSRETFPACLLQPLSFSGLLREHDRPFPPTTPRGDPPLPLPRFARSRFLCSRRGSQ